MAIFADMGLPMISLFLPPAWLAIIPIILIEAVVGVRVAKLPFRQPTATLSVECPGPTATGRSPVPAAETHWGGPSAPAAVWGVTFGAEAAGPRRLGRLAPAHPRLCRPSPPQPRSLSCRSEAPTNVPRGERGHGGPRVAIRQRLLSAVVLVQA